LLEHVDSLAARYRSRGLLLDTSPLLIFYLGLYAPEQIERFPRTRSEWFTSKDYEFILAFAGGFDRLVTTPHILTEVSNFSGQLHGHVRDGCFETFARHLAEPSTHEHSPPAERLAGKAEFVPFGISDASIAEIAAERYLVLTTDARLNAHLARQGVDSLNYNNFRLLLPDQT
jgi:hypothetical protein